MNTEKIRGFAQGILDELGPAPPLILPPTIPVFTTPDALDRALSFASAGDTLAVEPLLIYPGPLRLDKGITLRSTFSQPGRMLTDTPAPKFLGGMTLGDGVTVYGLEVTNARNVHTDIVTISGKDVWCDRLRILGDPQLGAKRGIAANGGGSVAIMRCYIDDCFQSYPGDDSQAICAWDMLPGLLIEDCRLSGGSETIMIGGADSSSEARSPREITIRKNVITKNPAWQALPIGVKNCLELKNARNVTIEDNDILYSWGGHGQDGYLVMFTVRNQGGKAPWSSVQDVLFGGNRLAHGAAACNILGRDNNQPSEPMARVQITQNEFTDIDPVKYTGSKKMNQIDGGPGDLTIRANRFTGAGMTSVVYFAGLPMCENCNIDGNTWPKTRYSVFGTNATVGQAFKQYVHTGTLGPNTEI